MEASPRPPRGGAPTDTGSGELSSIANVLPLFFLKVIAELRMRTAACPFLCSLVWSPHLTLELGMAASSLGLRRTWSPSPGQHPVK